MGVEDLAQCSGFHTRLGLRYLIEHIRQGMSQVVPAVGPGSKVDSHGHLLILVTNRQHDPTRAPIGC